MKKALLLGVLAASILSSGCDSIPTKDTTAPKDEGDVITGSRIPRKDGGSSGSVGTMGQDAYKQDRGTGSR
jgi:hypothetical protein